MSKVKSWLMQGSTIHGFAVLVGVAIAYHLRVLGADAAIPAIVAALIAIIMPEKPNVSTDAKKAAKDVLMLGASIAAGAGAGTAIESGIDAVADDLSQIVVDLK